VAVVSDELSVSGVNDGELLVLHMRNVVHALGGLSGHVHGVLPHETFDEEESGDEAGSHQHDHEDQTQAVATLVVDHCDSYHGLGLQHLRQQHRPLPYFVGHLLLQKYDVNDLDAVNRQSVQQHGRKERLFVPCEQQPHVGHDSINQYH